LLVGSYVNWGIVNFFALDAHDHWHPCIAPIPFAERPSKRNTKPLPEHF
jgi:hypothetical protein